MKFHTLNAEDMKYEESQNDFLEEILSNGRYNESERRDIIHHLAILGLKAYLQADQGTSDAINFNLLQKLSNDATNFLLCEIEKFPVNDIETNQFNNSGSNENRKARADYTSKYPFIDDVATISDVLQYENSENSEKISNFLSIGVPAQRRAVAKVFEELKVGSNFLKVIDLTVALRSLGLFVSYEVEVILRGVETTILECNEKDTIRSSAINFHQWKLFVDRFIGIAKMRTFNKDDAISLLASLLDPKSPPNHKSNINLVEIKPHPTTDILRNVADADTKEYSSTNVDMKFIPQNSPKKEKESISSKLKKVESKIKDKVQQDKKIWENAKSQQSKVAFEIVAKSRVDDLINQERKRIEEIVSPLTKSGKKGSRRQYQDLSSGSSAIAIADAFLLGLGKDLSKVNSSSLQDSVIKEEQINLVAPADRLASHEDIFSPLSIYSLKNLSSDNKNVEEPITSIFPDTIKEVLNDNEIKIKSKEIYHYQQISSNGGWIGDYGDNPIYSVTYETKTGEKKLFSNISMIESDEDERASDILATTFTKESPIQQRVISEPQLDQSSSVKATVTGPVRMFSYKSIEEQLRESAEILKSIDI